MKSTTSKGLSSKKEFLKNGKKRIFRKPEKLEEFELSKMGTNPFREAWRFNATPSNYQFRLKNSEDNRSYTIYTADVEILQEVEKGNFTPYLLEGKYLRIHLENNQDLRQKIYRLSSCSHSLLLWIIFAAQYGKDFVLLNKQHLMNQLGLSKGTVYKAEKELIQEGFIRKTRVVNYYWINCQFFFIGNRCHYLPEFVTTKDGLNIDEIRKDFKKRNSKTIKDRIHKGLEKLKNLK